MDCALETIAAELERKLQVTTVCVDVSSAMNVPNVTVPGRRRRV
jgi:hypothetical protein